MEPDSTTFDNIQSDKQLPFPTHARNLLLYKELTYNSEKRPLERQIIERLQSFGLLPKFVKCPTWKPDCKLVMKAARVMDRVQWCCEGCGKKLPIRTGSFFLRLQCSLLQALQIILAWCEDADCETAAQHFGIKQKAATIIYDKLDELAIKEQNKIRLGGDGAVVLTELYPDCLTRLSPDTTDQPHVHRILMIADTKHVPTRFNLHVIKDDLKKIGAFKKGFQKEIEEVIFQKTEPDSTIVTGSNLPGIEGTACLQQLLQHCDVDMQHFLSNRIWRQALALCAASRDLCSGAPGAGASLVCAGAVQRYLHTALYRLRFDDGFYCHVLRLLAEDPVLTAQQ